MDPDEMQYKPAPRKRAPRKVAARKIAPAARAALSPEEEAIAAQLAAPGAAPEEIPARREAAPAAPAPGARGLRIRKRTLRRAGIAALALIILLALLGAARVFHWGGWGLTAEEAQARQVAAIVREVGGLMYLPDETPQAAAVVDVTKLASQPFFADAKNGDEVLVYVHAGKAILYRPSAHRIVNVAPLSFGPAASTTSQ